MIRKTSSARLDPILFETMTSGGDEASSSHASSCPGFMPKVRTSRAIAGSCRLPATVTSVSSRTKTGATRGLATVMKLVWENSGMIVMPKPNATMVCTQFSRPLRETM